MCNSEIHPSLYQKLSQAILSYTNFLLGSSFTVMLVEKDKLSYSENRTVRSMSFGTFINTKFEDSEMKTIPTAS
jgi:hypothetical protein